MEIYMQMKDLCLDGNIIDNGWIEHLKYENGITHLNAVMILSEIVYWYRPVEIRDEYTGAVKGYKKKFKADKLQKSYDSLAERFGLTKRQVKDACDFLRKRGLIAIEFRHVKTKAGILPNVMFVEPIIENLKNITGINRIVNDTDNTKEDDGEVEASSQEVASPQASGGYPPFKRNIPPVKTEYTPPLNGTYPPLKRKTNTEITTKITTEITTDQSVSLVPGKEVKTSCQTMDRQTEKKVSQVKSPEKPKPHLPVCEVTEADIKNQIGYSALATLGDTSLLDEVVLNMFDMYHSSGVKIKDEVKPQAIVHSVLSKVTYWHVVYLLERFKQVTTTIKNKKSYLQTMIYNSVLEQQAHFTNQVKVDQLAWAQEDNIPPQEQDHKQYQATTRQPNQRDTFEQREYSDAELECFYANLVEEENAPLVPEAPMLELPVCERLPNPFLEAPSLISEEKSKWNVPQARHSQAGGGPPA